MDLEKPAWIAMFVADWGGPRSSMPAILRRCSLSWLRETLRQLNISMASFFPLGSISLWSSSCKRPPMELLIFRSRNYSVDGSYRGCVLSMYPTVLRVHLCIVLKSYSISLQSRKTASCRWSYSSSWAMALERALLFVSSYGDWLAAESDMISS